MTNEERFELHDQWLRSMESNLSQLAADMAQMGRNLAQVVSNQTQFSENLLRLVENQTQFGTALIALAEAHRKLEETVERYIRFRGNGREN